MPGCSSSSARIPAALFARLNRRGWCFHRVDTLSQAEPALASSRFDTILTRECLPNGNGYDLTRTVARHYGTLLAAVTLSETCLWLPAVNRGVKVLGRRAFNAHMLESELGVRLPLFAPERTHGD
jgi:hypothetical protein